MPSVIESIAFGVVISLLFAEFFGMSAAGLVVPGYLAYHWAEPLLLFGLGLATLLTYSSERLIASYTILFGRRLLSIDLLLSFIWVFLAEYLVLMTGLPVPLLFDPFAYFVPALVVIFIGSSGFKSTLFALAVNTSLVIITLNLLSKLR